MTYTLNEPKQNRENLLKTLRIDYYFKRVALFINWPQEKYDYDNVLFLNFVYPLGKSMILYLLCWKEFAVNYYSFTLSALYPGHSRLSLN